MALDRLRATLIDAVSSRVPPEYEVEAAGRYEGQFRERQSDAAIRLFETQGVDRNDKEIGRASSRERVCQSVYIQGVAVSLQNKQTTRKTTIRKDVHTLTD